MLTKSLLTASFISLATMVSAHATTFTYYDYDVVNNTGLFISGPSVSYQYIGAGQVVLLGSEANSGQNLDTWDLDVLLPLQPYEVVGGPHNYTFTFGSPVGYTATSQTSALTAAQISEIGGLMVYGDSVLLDGPLVSTAIQLAIWGIEYNDAYTLSSPTPGLISLASYYETEARNGTIVGNSNWSILTDAGNATEGYAAPEPASVMILGLGLFGLRLLRRRDA